MLLCVDGIVIVPHKTPISDAFSCDHFIIQLHSFVFIILSYHTWPLTIRTSVLYVFTLQVIDKYFGSNPNVAISFNAIYSAYQRFHWI